MRGSHQQHTVPRFRGPGLDVDRQEGLTLVELLVAMVILGFMLSSVAAVLITSVKASAASEQRVLATAAQSQVQEGFQAVPWELTGVYQQELDAFETRLEVDPQLADLRDRFEFETVPPTFDGHPIAVLLGPDCPGELPADGTASCEDREAQTPRIWSTPTIGSENYRIFQMVTWVDRSDPDDPVTVESVKRLTSMVWWTSSGRDIFDAFESERAPTSIEAGDPTGVRVWFDLAPGAMDLQPDGTPDRNIQAFVRFTEPMLTATLQFHRALPKLEPEEPTQIELVTVAMDAGAAAPIGVPGYVDFSVTLPEGFVGAGSLLFANGPWTFRAVGSRGDENFYGSRVITFSEGPFEDAPEDPFASDELGTLVPGEGEDDGSGDDDFVAPDEDVAITSVLITPTTMVRKQNNQQFRCSMTITVSAEGLTDIDRVIVTAEDGSSPLQFKLEPTPGPAVASGGQLFQVVLPKDNAHGFQDVDATRFIVKALRTDGEGDTVIGEEITFTSGGAGSC